MTDYDMEPANNPPVFVFDEEKASDEEKEYVLSFLILLEQFYDKYKYKSLDYIIKNVLEDSKKLEKNFMKKNQKIDIFFKETEKEVLIKNGVVTGKVKDVNISDDSLFDLKEEQKYTIASITAMIGLGILSKAHFSKYKNAEEKFSIDSNIREAVIRTKSMGTSGFATAKSIAQNKVLEFLYGDPLMDWVTMQDDLVSKECEDVEVNSPMLLSEMPLVPLHPNCRCYRKLHGKENSYKAKALDLIFY